MMCWRMGSTRRRVEKTTRPRTDDEGVLLIRNGDEGLEESAMLMVLDVQSGPLAIGGAVVF